MDLRSPHSLTRLDIPVSLGFSAAIPNPDDNYLVRFNYGDLPMFPNVRPISNVLLTVSPKSTALISSRPEARRG